MPDFFWDQTNAVPVDYLCSQWFFRPEWLQYMWVSDWQHRARGVRCMSSLTPLAAMPSACRFVTRGRDAAEAKKRGFVPVEVLLLLRIMGSSRCSQGNVEWQLQ